MGMGRRVASTMAGVAAIVALAICLDAQRPATAQLADITASTKIRFRHLASPDKKYIVESMSGGWR